MRLPSGCFPGRALPGKAGNALPQEGRMAGRMCVRPWPYAAKLCVLALAAALAACSDDSSIAGPPDPGTDPRPDADPGDTSVPPLVNRVDLHFEVNGAFRPGTPISVTAVARGRRQADDMTLDLIV